MRATMLCRQIMKQLLEAIKFIHEKNIVHRDVKVRVHFGLQYM